MEKALPYYKEAEQILLGCSLLDGQRVFPQLMAEDLKAEDFSAKNGKIYSVMLEMFKAGEIIDPITISVKLRQVGSLEEVGGPAYLSSLYDGMPHYSNVEAYCKIVREASLRRKLVKHTHNLLTQAWDDDGGQIRASVEKTIADLSTFAKDDRAPLRSFAEISPELISDIELRQANGGEILGLKTGFPDLDYLTGGFQPGQLITLAARPKKGKSAFAGNLAVNICKLNNASGIFFPLEMGIKEIGHRAISSTARVDMNRYKNGMLNKEEWKRILTATEYLNSLDLKFAHTPDLSIGKLRAQIKLHRVMNSGRLDYVIIDYFQLMSSDEVRRGDNRVNELTRISKGLKQIAMEENITVIMLSQLNREIEKRGNPKPQLSDLRESGSIEQDSDAIMFLYDKDPVNEPSIRTLYVAAQRSGPEGEVDLFWIPQLTLFETPFQSEAA